MQIIMLCRDNGVFSKGRRLRPATHADASEEPTWPELKARRPGFIVHIHT